MCLNFLFDNVICNAMTVFNHAPVSPDAGSVMYISWGDRFLFRKCIQMLIIAFRFIGMRHADKYPE